MSCACWSTEGRLRLFAISELPPGAMSLLLDGAPEADTCSFETLLDKVRAAGEAVVFAWVEDGSRPASSLGAGEGRTWVGESRVWPLCMCDKTLASCGEVEFDSGWPWVWREC